MHLSSNLISVAAYAVTLIEFLGDNLRVIERISRLVANHNNFTEETFLVFLSGCISPDARDEIIRESTELELVKTLPPEELINPLQEHQFPQAGKDRIYDIFFVLYDTLIGAKLENKFDVHQRIYLASLVMYCNRKMGYTQDILQNSAIPLVLERLFNTETSRQTMDWFLGFLFHELRWVMEWKLVEDNPRSCLLGALLIMAWQRQQETEEFHVILEYLLYHRLVDPNFEYGFRYKVVSDEWKECAAIAVRNAPEYRDAVFALLPMYDPL